MTSHLGVYAYSRLAIRRVKDHVSIGGNRSFCRRGRGMIRLEKCPDCEI